MKRPEALEFLIILLSKIEPFYLILGAPVLPVMALVQLYVVSYEVEVKFSLSAHVVSLRYTKIHLSLKRDEEKFEITSDGKKCEKRLVRVDWQVIHQSQETLDLTSPVG